VPSTNRFASVRRNVRNHPVLVATSAATIGVLLGGFVAAEIFAPNRPHADSAPAQQVAAKPKPAATPVAETTGSAPSGDAVASANCDTETWPYLSRVCADQLRSKQSGPRVISTDKLDKPTVSAMEAQPLAPPAPSVAQPAAPAIASTTPPPAPAIASTTPPPSTTPPAIGLAPVASTSFAKPEPALAVAPATAEAADAPPQPAATAEPKEKHVAKKVKRKPKPAVKPDTGDDDDNGTVASNDPAEQAADDQGDSRAHRRAGKRPHIVARWTEREYNVPASDGDQDGRRVIVRRGGGGLFENLFGLGRPRNDGDDD